MKTETSEPTVQPSPGTGLSTGIADVAEQTPPIVHLKKILVPLDLSDTSLKALHYAVSLARQFGAHLTILHVVPPPIYSAEVATADLAWPEHFEMIEKRLNEIRQTMIPADLGVDIAIRHTFTFDGILEVARENQADLIVVTTHGRTGLTHLLLGSTAENIVRRAPCPVLVVREVERDFV